MLLYCPTKNSRYLYLLLELRGHSRKMTLKHLRKNILINLDFFNFQHNLTSSCNTSSCDVCRKTFSDERYLRRHLKRFHSLQSTLNQEEVPIFIFEKSSERKIQLVTDFLTPNEMWNKIDFFFRFLNQQKPCCVKSVIKLLPTNSRWNLTHGFTLGIYISSATLSRCF